MVMPTLSQLKQEIETGPFAAELAPFWADVFGPHPTKKQLDYRIGLLKPDAGYAIYHLLLDRGRFRELDWGGFNYEYVVQAKQAE